MSRCTVLLAILGLVGCAGKVDNPEALTVKSFQLRSAVVETDTDPMVRGEQLKRLYGAVSMAERADRLGQYFTAQWSDPGGVGSGEVEVRFEYQQGATGSQIKRMSRSFPASEGAGTAEFAVIGQDYFKGGRVLAWKITLTRGGKVLASRQSYLWE